MTWLTWWWRRISGNYCDQMTLHCGAAYDTQGQGQGPNVRDDMIHHIYIMAEDTVNKS